MIKSSISVLLILLSHLATAQLSKLNLSIMSHFIEDTVCYKVCVTKMTDTLLHRLVVIDINEELDSLQPGSYKISVYRCSQPGEPEIRRSINLLPNKVTKVVLDISAEYTYGDLHPTTRKEIAKTRQEVQFNFFYNQPGWTEKNSLIRFGTGIGFTTYYWNAFSKHVGLLTGFGFGAARYGISNDTTFMNLTNQKKKGEAYNYFDAHVDLKLRFSIGSQQIDEMQLPRMLVDVGAVYYAPISFRHVAFYDNNKKITNYGLHQFTDLRAHLDVGFSPLILFVQYRLLDFIIGNYPELPKYNFGMKLTVN